MKVDQDLLETWARRVASGDPDIMHHAGIEMHRSIRELHAKYAELLEAASAVVYAGSSGDAMDAVPDLADVVVRHTGVPT